MIIDTYIPIAELKININNVIVVTSLNFNAIPHRQTDERGKQNKSHIETGGIFH